MVKLSPLNIEFRQFISQSAKDFNSRYPKFKRNKLIGYKLVKGIVACPEIYSILPNIRHLSSNTLDKLTHQFFVIKATLGRSANQVLCVEKNLKTGEYRDLLRGINWFPSSMAFIQHITKLISKKCPHKIIIEQYLGSEEEDRSIPYDFKLYFVHNKVRLINIYSRGQPQGKYMAMFDRNWNRIPKDKFYIAHHKYPEKKDDVPLPSLTCRKKLIAKAEKLGRKLKTKLCRFDFYCIGPYEQEKIFFGEITPICGGLSLHPLKPYGLKLIYPPKARTTSSSRRPNNTARPNGGRKKKNGKSIYYTGKKRK